MTGPAVLSTVAEGVATITLNRPEAMNALDLATKTALLDAVHAAADDTAVRCVVLTGTGRAFCVGQDLHEHVEGLRSGSVDELLATVTEHYNPVALALHRLEKPVVAAVNGVAAGAGASLAFLADLRIVAATAGFNLAFAGIALSCDTGASWTLPRLVGATRAMDLLLRPRTVSAEEALAIGLATEVVADADFADRVRSVATALAAGPTLAYASIRTAVDHSATHTLAESLAVEAELMGRTGASTDHARAVEAFLGKQRPSFIGS
ncbi:MAG TPA: enoyl-CoA hydratase-related protein [Microlunatus sp.]|nr:enoyl-CoA hydratase-related protein [Microlunatus sp.]